jgi:hypothetical protein
VIAPTVSGVVRCAGGWLFDRVMAGWDVTVHVADHADPQPLRILGARVVDLEGTLSGRANGPLPQSLAVDVQLCRSDPRAGTMVRAALDGGDVEVWLWLDGRPVGETDAGSTCHRLSLAARAFKAQALAAAAEASDPVGLIESFRRTYEEAPALAPGAASPVRLPASVS